jgi:DNA-directed RNA polymerase I subunit RPA49
MLDVGTPYQLVFYSLFYLDTFSYLLAIRDPQTSKIKILPAAKSPYILTRTVKALKSITPADASALAYREARTALGETFGTKKAKAAIRAQERNRVDVGAMQGVMQHVIEGIDEKAEGLLTKGKLGVLVVCVLSG